MSGFYLIPGLRLLHHHPTLVIQSLGIHIGEPRRHMLHDNHAGNIRSEVLHHGKNGLCTACGSADGHHQIASLGRKHRLLLLHGLLFDPADIGCGRNLDLHQQFVLNKRFELFPGRHRRFCHKVHRPHIQRVKHLVAQGADHHHRERILGHQLAQKLDAVHSGEFHVQGHHIRLMRDNGVPGLIRIPRRGHHPDSRIPVQVLYQQFPEHHGVLND